MAVKGEDSRVDGVEGSASLVADWLLGSLFLVIFFLALPFSGHSSPWFIDRFQQIFGDHRCVSSVGW